MNGDIEVALNRLGNKPMSFSTMSGDVDVTLPADAKASLKMKTQTGEVYSEVVKRPLYAVQCSQLGTDEEELEKELREVLDRAARWKAIPIPRAPSAGPTRRICPSS
jgi:predicted membrane protein